MRFHLIVLSAVAIIVAMLLLPACDSGRLKHRRSGISVSVPEGWRVYSQEEIQTAHLESARRQGVEDPGPTRVIFRFMKYEEPTERLNPGVIIFWYLLAGDWMDRSALDLFENIHAANIPAGMTWVEMPVSTKFQGYPAARGVARRTIAGESGREYTFVTELWVVHRGEDVVSIQLSGAESGPEQAAEEFEAVLASVELRRPS